MEAMQVISYLLNLKRREGGEQEKPSSDFPEPQKEVSGGSLELQARCEAIKKTFASTGRKKKFVGGRPSYKLRYGGRVELKAQFDTGTNTANTANMANMEEYRLYIACCTFQQTVSMPAQTFLFLD